MTNSEIIQAFVDAWNRNDTEAALAFLSEDILYHNIPMPLLEGIEAVREFFANVGTISDTRWVMLNIAENDNVVLTERLDDFKLNGKQVSLPVMGTFVLKQGKITEWRDYFDLATFQNQLV